MPAANGTGGARGEPAPFRYWVIRREEPRDPGRLRRLSLLPAAPTSPLETGALASGTWTALPPSLDPRFRDAARRVTARAGLSSSSWERAVALETWLREEFAYTRVPVELDAAQPLATFLFESRRGHCVFFASALAVLLRASGIPSRVVGGYLSGEVDTLTGDLVVRQRDAHAWVEAHLGAAGWVRFDATPAAGDPPQSGLARAAADALAGGWRSLRSYSPDDQVALLSVAGRLALPLVLAAACWAAARRWSRVRRGRLRRLHTRAWRLVAERGWRIPRGLPPRDGAAWLAEQVWEGEALVELVGLHYRVRYAGEDEDAVLDMARQAARRLRRLPTCKSEHHGPWSAGPVADRSAGHSNSG